MRRSKRSWKRRRKQRTGRELSNLPLSAREPSGDQGRTGSFLIFIPHNDRGFRNEEVSLCSHPSSSLHLQDKVPLDFPLFPGIVEPVDNYIWSAGALLSFFFFRGTQAIRGNGNRPSWPNRPALTHLESTLVKYSKNTLLTIFR